MSRQPNFLFSITDRQRADWLGRYGDPVVQTPHTDALAANGNRLTNQLPVDAGTALWLLRLSRMQHREHDCRIVERRAKLTPVEG